MNEGGWVDGNTTKRIGFTHHGGCSREGCDGNEMALVRTIACAANNGRSCDIMFVGGYFSDAMGTEASSIARINQVSDAAHIVHGRYCTRQILYAADIAHD